MTSSALPDGKPALSPSAPLGINSVEGRARWQVLPPLTPSQLQRLSPFHPFLSHLLFHRGLVDAAAAATFLSADARFQGDPFLLPDMATAVVRLVRALGRGERLAVFGDFDVDGVAGTALLVQELSLLGAAVRPYIPHRFTEGYGLNTAAIDALHGEGVTLLLTVDTGTSALQEIAHARRLGMEVIVTDHHAIPEQLPEALAIINPHRPESPYPFPDLCGAGVAFKLLQALAMAQGRDPATLEHGLDLVALATVADLAPLVGENRFLVKRGLERLNHTARPGLLALVERAGLSLGGLDAEDIGYGLGPRLNAAGRIDHALTSYRLLSTSSDEEARALAEELENMNQERRRLTQEVLDQARAQVLAQDPQAPILIAAGKEFSAGVVGLVASRLAEEWYRPAVVIEQGEEMSRGSARSIPQFNVVAAVAQCRDLLLRYGGHHQAAGFTVLTQNLPAFRERLLAVAARELAGTELTPTLLIDAEFPLAGLPPNAMPLLQQIAPFGIGNPAPLFLSRGVAVQEHRLVGSAQQHLRLKLRDGPFVWYGMAFGQGDRAGVIAPRLDLVYALEVDTFSRDGALRLDVRDFAPAL